MTFTETPMEDLRALADAGQMPMADYVAEGQRRANTPTPPLNDAGKTALLPCPYCCGTAEYVCEGDHHGEFFRLGCVDEACPAHWLYYTEPMENAAFAIQCWNTRAPLGDLRALADGGWQDISTAPKDGTEIIGYRPDQGVFVFRWSSMEEHVPKDANGDPTEDYDDEFACWFHDRWGWMQGECTPTLWQPYPSFPGASAASLCRGCGGSRRMPHMDYHDNIYYGECYLCRPSPAAPGTHHPTPAVDARDGEKRLREALASLKLFVERIETNGEWDDGCFYYAGRSASELQEPPLRAHAALAQEPSR